jgi:hypothetical protein
VGPATSSKPVVWLEHHYQLRRYLINIISHQHCIILPLQSISLPLPTCYKHKHPSHSYTHYIIDYVLSMTYLKIMVANHICNFIPFYGVILKVQSTDQPFTQPLAIITRWYGMRMSACDVNALHPFLFKCWSNHSTRTPNRRIQTCCDNSIQYTCNLRWQRPLHQIRGIA